MQINYLQTLNRAEREYRLMSNIKYIVYYRVGFKFIKSNNCTQLRIN